ncbi:MAG: ATP-binding protein [Gemmataceae bacterium]
MLAPVLGAVAPAARRSSPVPPAASRSAEDRIRELEDRLAAADARIRESAGFEAVGRLLAGAAHDFNNLLTLATGHAELVRENLMADSPLRESVDVIISSGHTAARVARQLLAYSQPSNAADSATMDPNAAVAESHMILSKMVGSRIELDLLLAPGVAPIRASRSDFDRVVLNLVSNAKDAIEDAGVIAVRTATATVPANRRGWPAECPPGEYVAITVSDTGCGMTDEVKARVFNRFFTTKGEKGTGLGLATVRDIVRAAGGHVELESSTDWGTSVRVFWPAAAEDDEPVSLSFEEALVACGMITFFVSRSRPRSRIAGRMRFARGWS